MSNTSLTLIYVTTPDETTAKTIARTLLQEKLIACANILPHMTSLYHWDNAIQCNSECVLLLKTCNIPFQTLEKRITELHPYDIPCIFSINTKNTSQPYLSWLQQSLS